MADNLSVYDKVRKVPPTALKEIQAGRLKGKSDINPMWRIKALTEQFGPCGMGWKYVIDEKRLEKGGNEEVSAFVDISLYIKVDGEWSAAIPGTGGSSFIAKEKNGLYMSDECFKMALTDAISVSCKSLGVGADVYWEKDTTKYTSKPQGNTPPPTPPSTPSTTPPKLSNETITENQAKRMFAIAGNPQIVQAMLIKEGYKNSTDVKKTEYERICKELEKKGEVK